MIDLNISFFRPWKALIKLIEKKQFNLNQKHSSSIKPLLVLQQSVSRDKELIKDIGMGIEMIAESPIIPVQKK